MPYSVEATYGDSEHDECEFHFDIQYTVHRGDVDISVVLLTGVTVWIDRKQGIYCEPETSSPVRWDVDESFENFFIEKARENLEYQLEAEQDEKVERLIDQDRIGEI